MSYYEHVPRKSSQTFRSGSLEDLARQMQFAPVPARHEQVRRAEKLHDELQPDANYPFDYLKYRITRYRDDKSSDIVLVGDAALADLRLLIDKVTASAPLPLADDDPVDTIGTLAARLSVSVKTIARWRKKGLRWRWVQRSGDEPPCIAVTHDAVAIFQQTFGDRVKQAKTFTRMDEKTRAQLIEKARTELASESLSPHQVAVRLAPESGRAVESLRQLLDEHDRQNPDNRLFPDRNHPLTPQEKHEIAEAFAAGVKIGVLAKQYSKTVSSIRRSLYEHRAAGLRRLNIEWVASPTFARKDVDEVLLRPEPMEALIRAFKHVDELKPKVDDLPEPIRPLFEQPTLDAEHQRSLAVRMNYLKFRGAARRDALDRHEPRVRDMNLIQDDLDQAQFIRDRLVACNLSTILSVGRRHLIGLPENARNTAALLTILEIGVEVLVEEVDRYDARRNRTFQRHVTWATMSELSHREGDILEVARSSDSSLKAKARSRTNVRVNRSADKVLVRMRKIATSHGVALPSFGPSIKK